VQQLGRGAEALAYAGRQSLDCPAHRAIVFVRRIFFCSCTMP
jgi:hypothetical protein